MIGETKMTEGSKSKNSITPKKEGNLNALVHGFYASEIVLPWESAEEFEQLHKDLKNEWSPDGRMEQETVVSLARLFWIKRRLMRTWDLGFRKDPLVEEIANSGKKSWAEIIDYLRDQAKAYFNEFDAANDLYSKMKAITDVLHEETARRLQKQEEKGPDWDNIIKLDTELRSHMQLLHKFFIQPAKTGRPRNRKEIFDQAYLPEFLEKIIGLEAALDARIDKTVARLVNLKEYKKLAGSNRAPLLVSQGSNLVPAAVRQKVVDHKNATKQRNFLKRAAIDTLTREDA
jgi:hypothetical protein